MEAKLGGETAQNLSDGLHSVRTIWIDWKKKYFIPPYQRGYKWTVSEVRKLLEDINNFRDDSQVVPYYCLQNITLKQCGVTDAVAEMEQWNVVDGQQRLTTTLLILSYFRKKQPALLPNISSELVYGVRAESQCFLRDEILSGTIWDLAPECGASVLLSRDANLVRHLHEAFRKRLEAWKITGKTERDHSDIFHLYCAALTIDAFFKQEDVRLKLGEFVSKFLDHVRFLVNDRNDSLKESEMFSKINGFRVPLDGADLLRAIFVTDVARKRLADSQVQDKFYGEIRLTEEHIKLGMTLDEIASWWSVKSHCNYFMMLDDSVKDLDEAFNVARYPINHLYKLFEAARQRLQISLEDFEKRLNGVDVSKMFEEILHLQAVLRDWYEDKCLYHYAGYLCAQCGSSWSFSRIFQRMGKAHSRRKLYRHLKLAMFYDLIANVEVRTEWGNLTKRELRKKRFEALLDKIVTNGHNWYGEKGLHVKKVLILLDVIAFAQKPSEEDSVYHPIVDRLDAEFFKAQDEDKEHIFPQTPIGKESMKTLEKMQRAVREYWSLVAHDCKDKAALKERWSVYWANQEKTDPLRENAFPIDDIKEMDLKWLLQDQNSALERTKARINDFVATELKIDLNSIGNIVLLNRVTNRSYGNDFYPRKRQRILSDYRKNFSIRLHTRSVFAKEFPDDMTHGDDGGLDAWTQVSIENNRRFVKRQLCEFFKEVCDVGA